MQKPPPPAFPDSEAFGRAKRDAEEVENLLAELAAAIRPVTPEGARVVLLVSLDGVHVDCLHNLPSMDHAADAMRDYLDSRDAGRPVAREGEVRAN